MQTLFKKNKRTLSRSGVIAIIFVLLSGGIVSSWPQTAFATATVTTATGGSSISADTTGGSYTTLTGPTLAEGATSDFPSSGTIVLSAPLGFQFNTGTTVTTVISRTGGHKTCFSFTSTTATPSATTITFTLNATDGGGGTTCQVVFSNIQVRPTAGTPLASGSITDTGTASINGITSSTNLGNLTEVAGAKNKLAITTQPSATATAGVNFTTNPVVALEDQYGNTVTTNNSSTVTEAVVLSGQLCGGTPGSGTLTSTPSSGSAVTSGVMAYTAMQYSAAESIQICFSSSGVTSAISNTVTVSALISITITSSGTISYGTLAAGVSSSTVPAYTQTAKNSGTGLETFDIKGQNTACPWTLASTSGTNQYIQEFSTNGGSSWTALTTNYQTLAISIAANNTQNFDLRLTAPSSTSCFNQQSVDVTIQAVAG